MVYFKIYLKKPLLKYLIRVFRPFVKIFNFLGLQADSMCGKYVHTCKIKKLYFNVFGI